VTDDVELEGEASLRSLVELASDWYWEQDENLRFIHFSRGIEKSGLPAVDLVGKTRWEIVGLKGVSKERWAEHRATVEAHRPFRDFEYQQPGPDGRSVWVTVSGLPVFDKQGAFKGYRGIARDVSEQRHAEQALRESEQRFKMFMDNSPAVAWIKDSALRYTWVSGTFEKLVGKSPAELLGRDEFEVGWPKEAAQQARDNDHAVLRSGAPHQAIDIGPHPDGTQHHWLNVKFPLPDETGALGVAGMAIDITERVRAEEMARRYSGKIRELFARLVSTQESERKRLAAELHDLIGQNLTALGIALTNAANAIGDRRPAPIKAQLAAMKRTVQQTIKAIRGVMTELRPPALDEFGLFPALRTYMTDFQARTSLRALADFPGEPRRLPAALELTLFRIVQEALTNAAKHSGGSSVRVAIELTDKAVRLAVEDDGRGISKPASAAQSRRAGWGLPTIRERAEAHGGAMRIEHPERGFRLIVDIPVPGQ